MITYDRAIRQTIHSTLRRFCGPIDSTRRSVGTDAPLRTHDGAAIACIGASCRRRDPAPTSRKRRLACVAGIAIALAAMIAPSRPAAAQEQAQPPISGATSATLFLPAVAHTWHAWYTEAELDDAMRRAGYDVTIASMHTVCILDPTAVPPYLLRYTSCEQYLIGDQPTEGTDHFVWYIRMGDGIVTGVEVGQ